MVNATTDATQEAARRYWVFKNHGVIRRIARELSVSHVFVQDVLRRKRNSKNRRVEAKLTELGAPGFVDEVPEGGTEAPYAE